MSHTEQEATDGAEYRRRLYDVMADGDATVSEKQDQVLEAGREFLGVENAHVERISDDGQTHEVVASTGLPETLATGAVLEQSATYCSRTVERDSPLAVSDARDTEFESLTAAREWEIACYLGAPITVDGAVYGTVCFVSTDPRDHEFEPGERAFVELVATMFGREIESRRHERELDERERELDERERELERTERELARTEHKYESLVTTAPDAIFLVDVETREIREANDAAAEMLGRDRETLGGLPVSEVYPDGERDRYEATFAEFLADPGTRSRLVDGDPIRVARADGSTVPVEISARVVELDGGAYLQGIARDVSDRRERQRELRVKNRAVEAADVGVTIADASTPDNDLVYVNDRFAEITGHDPDEMMGQNCRLLQGPETDPEAVAALAAGIDAEESVSTELLNYRADGTPFWNAVTVTPVADETGETTHFVGFQRDVTARKRRERLVTVLNRVLRHNLRNSASVITGLAEEIAARADPETARFADLIGDRGWDLAALGDKAATLDTIVHERRSASPRPVVPAVEAAVDSVRSATETGSVSVTVDDRAAAVATDRLSLAVSELVENAVQHGGRDPTVRVRVETDDEEVRVRVSDDGPGLPANERSVLRLGRETKLEHGNGLGLWLVNWVVTDAGGHVTTAVDDGTTVTLHFLRPGETAPDGDSPRVLGT